MGGIDPLAATGREWLVPLPYPLRRGIIGETGKKMPVFTPMAMMPLASGNTIFSGPLYRVMMVIRMWLRWGVFEPMDTGCSICPVTSGNGPVLCINWITMEARSIVYPKGLTESEWFAAAAGSTNQGTSGRRSVTGSIRMLRTSTSVFVLPGNSSSLRFALFPFEIRAQRGSRADFRCQF
uniref:Uncharacterized protein n=1 Tax=Candidatus Kentrum sp. TC TaxID=2126339 RepID=A0A450Z7M0_9GAMM|nr:MAG: hypothetical protein BECKTC1821D_GA0114238_108314 [Candidatus Kentron sp. TC]